MWVNAVLAYWMQAPWPVAVLLATAVHLAIYLVGAATGAWLTGSLWPRHGIGRPIDARPPAPGQVRAEVRRGLLTCLIFGVVTLSYRPLCQGLWPLSWAQAAWQLAAFAVFNNLYTYGTHRLLHTRLLIRVHRVHHRSVRVTPWSGYSVHPLEALVIAGTLPVFMLLVKLGIGTAFALHALGMLYTTCIHCNYELFPARDPRSRFKRWIDDPAFHRLHHTRGSINYGFPSRLPDRLFGTAQE